MNDRTIQWNAGGWFGAQLGSTCWMLVAAIILSSRDLTPALLTLGVFVAINVIGTIMWIQRAHLRPVPAIQGLVVLAGIGSALATYVMDSAGQFESLGKGGQVSATSMYFVLALMVPALLLVFQLIERPGLSSDDDGEHNH